jgi:calcium-dependent protein kinase
LQQVDIWSAGIVWYILLAGYPPDSQSIRHSAAALDYPSPFFDAVSMETRELISACLNIDASKRPSARDALAALEDITPAVWAFPA